jgi:hypothetical protein
MKSWRAALGLGLLVWLVPFVVAFCILAIKDSWRSLFESIMAVTVAAVVVVGGVYYFRAPGRGGAGEGVKLGALWMAISVLIDLPLMLSPPISYTPQEYAADVGATYLLMPIIAAGMGWAVERQNSPDH